MEPPKKPQLPSKTKHEERQQICRENVPEQFISPNFPHLSQEEFRMSLDKEGLTRNNRDDFQIRDELSNVDDEIGGGTESCVLFEGEYYYPLFGPIGGPDGEWELEYELAGKRIEGDSMRIPLKSLEREVR